MDYHDSASEEEGDSTAREDVDELGRHYAR